MRFNKLWWVHQCCSMISCLPITCACRYNVFSISTPILWYNISINLFQLQAPNDNGDSNNVELEWSHVSTISLSPATTLGRSPDGRVNTLLKSMHQTYFCALTGYCKDIRRFSQWKNVEGFFQQIFADPICKRFCRRRATSYSIYSKKTLIEHYLSLLCNTEWPQWLVSNWQTWSRTIWY